MLPDGAFRALLLLLISAASAAEIEPWGNVTVSCQNLETAVSWKYGETQTTFNVTLISSSGKRYETNTTEHQLDVSPSVWESEDQYMSFHYVEVTPIRRGYKSAPLKSHSFTFNDLKLANVKCALDFPPVTLTAEGALNFSNPFNFYRRLKEAKNKSAAPYFEFRVFTDHGNETDGRCDPQDPVCRAVIQFSDGAEKCVRLRGRLYDASQINCVVFRETGRVCATESSDDHMVTLTVLLCVFASVFTLIIVAICKLRAWTMKVPTGPDRPPSSLVMAPRNDSELLLRNRTDHEDVSRVTVTDNRAFASSSGSSTEDLQGGGGGGGGGGSNSNQSLCPGYLYGSGALTGPEGHKADEASADNPESVLMEEEEEEEEEEEVRAHYDRPHIQQRSLSRSLSARSNTD